MTATESMQSTAPAKDTVDVPVRLDFDAHAADFAGALAHIAAAATKELDRVKFDQQLRELVRLRASQLNGCAYCVDMHTKDARAIGETEQRLYALAVWPDTPAFTEAVTLMTADHVPDAAYNTVATHFSPDEVAALLALIIAINAWNAIGV